MAACAGSGTPHVLPPEVANVGQQTSSSSNATRWQPAPAEDPSLCPHWRCNLNVAADEHAVIVGSLKAILLNRRQIEIHELGVVVSCAIVAQRRKSDRDGCVATSHAVASEGGHSCASRRFYRCALRAPMQNLPEVATCTRGAQLRAPALHL